jgi:ParB-like chromosome segregation protein Spo0J
MSAVLNGVAPKPAAKKKGWQGAGMYATGVAKPPKNEVAARQEFHIGDEVKLKGATVRGYVKRVEEVGGGRKQYLIRWSDGTEAWKVPGDLELLPSEFDAPSESPAAPLASEAPRFGKRWVKLVCLEANPWQPRQTFEVADLDKLAESIAEIGLLQCPVVRCAPGDWFIDESGNPKQPGFYVLDRGRIKCEHSMPYCRNCDPDCRSYAGPTHARFATREIAEKYLEHFQIACGERRVRAVKLARNKGWLPNPNEATAWPPGLRMVDGEIEIECDVRDLSDQQMAEIAIEENAKRADVNPIEKATAWKRLADEFDVKQKVIAQRAGVSEGAVSHALRILELPQSVQQLISSGALSESHGKALVQYKAHEAFLIAYAHYIVENEIPAKQIEKGVVLSCNYHAFSKFFFIAPDWAAEKWHKENPDLFFKSANNFWLCFDRKRFDELMRQHEQDKAAQRAQEAAVQSAESAAPVAASENAASKSSEAEVEPEWKRRQREEEAARELRVEQLRARVAQIEPLAGSLLRGESPDGLSLMALLYLAVDYDDFLDLPDGDALKQIAQLAGVELPDEVVAAWCAIEERCVVSAQNDDDYSNEDECRDKWLALAPIGAASVLKLLIAAQLANEPRYEYAWRDRAVRYEMFLKLCGVDVSAVEGKEA